MMTRVEGGLERVSLGVIAAIGGTGAVARERVQEATRRAVVSAIAPDEMLTRLEAIEARLSTIERLLREQRGGASEVS
jgi:hypothetical protein